MLIIFLVKLIGFTLPLVVMWVVLREKKKRKYEEFRKYWEKDEVPGNYYDVLVEKNPGIVPKEQMLN